MPSYANGASEVPLLGETIGVSLERAASRYPDHEALIACRQGLRFTYSELDAEVDRLARALLTLGLDKGDRLGIWSPNRAEWALTQYATAKIGVILVTINPAYRVSELEYVLQQSTCRALVAAPSFKGSDYVAMVEAVRPKLPSLEHMIIFDSPAWDGLLAGGSSTSVAELEARKASLDFDEPINIQYTSGTTGFPKGATLTHHNILNNGFFVGEGCGIDDTDRICVPVPYYHCFGMVMGNLAAMTHGASVVLPADAFTPDSVLDAVEAERCTVLYGVPTMFIAELEDPTFDARDLSSLRTGIMAGSPCPVDVMRQVIDRMHMTDVTICYGMTETSPVSTQTRRDDDLEHRTATVGAAHPHVEIRIADPQTGRTVPRGAPGEFQTRGYSVMLGYWDDDEQTSEAIDVAGWMHTGDLAVMDHDGYVRIVGRIKDMIIRAGENVYPREIEEHLYKHPDVSDVQVVGVPDARRGEEAAAWVVRRAGSTVTEEELRRHCVDQIAHYKVPRYVLFTDDFPMTVTGKVQKYKLREMAIETLDLSEAASAATA